jgi:hypothetical protein
MTGVSIRAIGKEVVMKRICLAVVVLLAFAILPGCGTTTTDFGIKGGPGFDVNPLAGLVSEPVFRPANGPGYVNGDPQDCRLRH